MILYHRRTISIIMELMAVVAILMSTPVTQKKSYIISAFCVIFEVDIEIDKLRSYDVN